MFQHFVSVREGLTSDEAVDVANKRELQDIVNYKTPCLTKQKNLQNF